MKKIDIKKQPRAKKDKHVQKLGLVLGALERQVAPGTQARPVTCIRVYCIEN